MEKVRPVISGDSNQGYSIDLHDCTTYDFWGSKESMEKLGIFEDHLAPGVQEILEISIIEGGREGAEEAIFQLFAAKGQLVNTEE